MDTVIVVKDSAGAPIGGAAVVRTVSGASVNGISDGQGRVILGDMPAESFSVEVTRSSYLDETVDVNPPPAGGSFTWDNPVCLLVPPATLEVRMSRLRAAPTAAMSNVNLEQEREFGPQAAFTWIDDHGNPTKRYLGTYNDVQSDFTAVSHPLFPESPTDGWGRIRHEASPVVVDPSRSGDLVWLEWGLGQPEPRLVVAVWIPRFRGATPSQLDFVIFFTPSTQHFPADAYPWLEKYPYWAWKGKVPLRPGGPLPLVQPYIGLAHRYMFAEKWLVHQLMAAKRQAVVVLPSQPYGQWGPFGDVAGLSRLITEISHFIHRTGYIQTGADDTDQDQAPMPNYRFGRVGIHQPPPTARRIVLSGFSRGVGAIVTMLGSQVGQRLTVDPLTHELFGANVAPFLEAWKEVWDHDAPGSVRKAMDASLPAWLKRSSDRMARCYQSDFTGSRGWIDSTPLTAFVSAATKPVQAGPADAAERHSDPRCSLVFFGKGYLQHPSAQSPRPPVFWTATNDHQAVPLVTFGHAARLSGIAKV